MKRCCPILSNVVQCCPTFIAFDSILWMKWFSVLVYFVSVNVGKALFHFSLGTGRDIVPLANSLSYLEQQQARLNFDKIASSCLDSCFGLWIEETRVSMDAGVYKVERLLISFPLVFDLFPRSIKKLFDFLPHWI